MSENQIRSFRQEIQQEMEALLDWWINNMVDEENGGFYGRRGAHNQLFPEADKAIILNSRILWTFAAAAQYTGRTHYREIADRAHQYLLKFWDSEAGGVFWMLDFQGKPVNRRKQIYAQAFYLYALVEYGKLSNNPEVDRNAFNLYKLIEKHSRDAENGGYWEALGPDWETIEDLRLSERDANEAKSMNTHLHLMEAYTNYYRFSNHKEIGSALSRLIDNFVDHFIDPETGHLRLFFDEQWKLRSEVISFGHDIECSWLLTEAIDLFEDPQIQQAGHEIAIQMAGATLQNGLDWDGSLCNEKHADGTLDKEKIWWPQAEAVIGFWNAWQISGEPKYQQAALKTWQFIKAFMRDKSQGEWFWSVNEKRVPNFKEDRAGSWKAPYHNVRMCLEILQRTEADGP